LKNALMGQVHQADFLKFRHMVQRVIEN